MVPSPWVRLSLSFHVQLSPSLQAGPSAPPSWPPRSIWPVFSSAASASVSLRLVSAPPFPSTYVGAAHPSRPNNRPHSVPQPSFTPNPSLASVWRTGSALPPSQAPSAASSPLASSKPTWPAHSRATTGNSSSSSKVPAFSPSVSPAHWPCSGIPAFVLGFFTLFFLPDRPETTRYLSDGQERELAIARVNRGTQSEVGGTINKRISSFSTLRAFLTPAQITYDWPSETGRSTWAASFTLASTPPSPLFLPSSPLSSRCVDIFF